MLDVTNHERMTATKTRPLPLLFLADRMTATLVFVIVAAPSFDLS